MWNGLHYYFRLVTLLCIVNDEYTAACMHVLISMHYNTISCVNSYWRSNSDYYDHRNSCWNSLCTLQEKSPR